MDLHAGVTVHGLSGIKAVVGMVGKQSHTEDDDEHGMVSVDVPTVWYSLYVDGRLAGRHHLPETDFRQKFGLGDSEGASPKVRPFT